MESLVSAGKGVLYPCPYAEGPMRLSAYAGFGILRRATPPLDAWSVTGPQGR